MTMLKINTTRSTIAMASIAPRKPIQESRAAPTKKPTPFRAFLEPVRMDIHLNKVDWALSATSILMLDLALILFKSLAIPESACATMTYATVSHCGSTSSIANAITCNNKPRCIVTFNPTLAASQPPTRFVTMPKNSYRTNSIATSSGL